MSTIAFYWEKGRLFFYDNEGVSNSPLIGSAGIIQYQKGLGLEKIPMHKSYLSVTIRLLFLLFCNVTDGKERNRGAIYRF